MLRAFILLVEEGVEEGGAGVAYCRSEFLRKSPVGKGALPKLYM